MARGAVTRVCRSSGSSQGHGAVHSDLEASSRTVTETTPIIGGRETKTSAIRDFLTSESQCNVSH